MTKSTKLGIGLLLILGTLSGCKPKQIISERVVTKVDSALLISLKSEVSKKEAIIENLQSDLERTREEVSRLQSEASSHTINYDTAGQINPQTGKYPIANETITSTKTSYEKTIKEMETLIKEYQREVESLENKNKNMSYELNLLKDENSELKSKTTPTTGFNFRLIFWSFIVGVIVTSVFFLRGKIKRLFTI